MAGWLTALEASAATPLYWPEPTSTARPWTRWWWHGSAVDDANLARLLAEYQRVGLGGVEITCIYPVQGNEHRNRRYLSPEWRDAVQSAVDHAHKLDLQVDLPTGSGWRMGGPWLAPEFGNLQADVKTVPAPGGQTFDLRLERGTLQAAQATSSSGERLNLMPFAPDNRIVWSAPLGKWQVTTLAHRWSGDRVKRPAPGGEGLNINPYWRESFAAFLAGYAPPIEPLHGARAQFHDSFEYEGNWQPKFFDEFAERRGYRLEDYLWELAGNDDSNRAHRVRADYRATLSELVHDELTVPWTEWCHSRGELVRNQAHGSPANWLDLYAAVDIPETESFGRLTGGDADPLVLKFASSAANVAGRRLVACETATWLDEHFHVTLAQIKQLVDRQMLAGVNHVVYHGTAYSPADAPWPGWVFYASTQLNPQNPIWRDLPTLNAYITRCQSLLQTSQPDHDVLLYWPLHDTWHQGSGLRQNIRVHNGEEWFYGQPFGEAATTLQRLGYQFDFVSDRLLQRCRPGGNGTIVAPGGTYRAVVLPRAKYLPEATLRVLTELAEQGVTIVQWGEPATSPPGMAGLQPHANWQSLRARLQASKSFHQSDDLPALLANSALQPELWGPNLQAIRRRDASGVWYLVVNLSDEALDQVVTPGAASGAFALLDPLTGRIGYAPSGQQAGGRGVRLQLPPRGSLVVRCVDGTSAGPTWEYDRPAGQPLAVDGPWHLEFLAGGPELPAACELATPLPWTELPDRAEEAFAGTASYRTQLDIPANAPSIYRLDLGEVYGSARIRIDGTLVGTLLGPDYAVTLPSLEAGQHTLAIEVTGVAANRVRDLDRRGVKWKVFTDINIVSSEYKPLDASDWPVVPSGLRGPVTVSRVE